MLKKHTKLIITVAQMLKVKDCYRRILIHEQLLDIDSQEIRDDAADSDFSTSDED